jgi:hypothetical protein
MQNPELTAASVVAFKHLTGRDLTVDRFGHHFPDVEDHIKNRTVALMALLLDAISYRPGLSNQLARGRGSLGSHIKKVADNLTGNELLALVCETLAVKESLTC